MVALLVLALSVAAASADPLSQARAAMSSASFEKALGIADKALKTVKDPARRGALELVRAECFHALRKSAQLKEALERALRTDPLAALDVSSVNPELVAELDQQRKALAGRLVISGSFARNGAPLVMMDEVKLGLAPVTMKADVGRHRVELSWPAGDVQEEDVVIRAETDSTLVLSRAAPSALAEEEASPREPEAAPPEPEAAAPPQPVAARKKVERSSGVRWQLISIGAGAVVTVSGVVCLGVAASRYNALTGGSGTSTLMLDREGAAAYARTGQAIQAAGIALTVVGLLAVGAGALGLLLGGGGSGPQVAIGIGPAGASLALAGSF